MTIKNKRVLLLHRGVNYIRGTEVCLIKFSEALKVAGAKLYLVCNHLELLNNEINVGLGCAQEMPLDDVVYGKKFWTQPYVKHWLEVFKLAKFCSVNKIDVIYASGGAPTQLAVHAGRYFNVTAKVFSHFHHPATNLYYKSWALDAADIVVTPSNYTATELLAAGVDSQVIYNGVDVPVANINERDQNKKIARLSFVGHLEPNKRVNWLLIAVAQLKAQGYEMHLDVVGTGSQYSFLIGLAEELHIDDRVTFHGRVESIYEVLLASDFHVSASDCEGLGISVIEAALCGIPSVVSASTGLLEVVEDGVTGWYFDATSIDSLVDVLRQRIVAIDNAQYGMNARERALRMFSEDDYKKNMLKAFAQLL
jgi:glycosyltransferase involved in cell wall biosynthesis